MVGRRWHPLHHQQERRLSLRLRLAAHGQKHQRKFIAWSYRRSRELLSLDVAQSCTLLYRGFAIRCAWAGRDAWASSNELQNAILRYGRIQFCATSSGEDVRQLCAPSFPVDFGVSFD